MSDDAKHVMCFTGLHFWCDDPLICGLFGGLRWRGCMALKRAWNRPSTAQVVRDAFVQHYELNTALKLADRKYLGFHNKPKDPMDFHL